MLPQQTSGTHPSYNPHNTRQCWDTHTKLPPLTVLSPKGLLRLGLIPLLFISPSLMPALADSSSDTGSHLRTQERWYIPDCDQSFMSSQSQQRVSVATQWCRQPAVDNAINITSIHIASEMFTRGTLFFTTSHRSRQRFWHWKSEWLGRTGIGWQEFAVSECQEQVSLSLYFFSLSLYDASKTTISEHCRLSITSLFLVPSWSRKFTLPSSWWSICPRARWKPLDWRWNKERHSLAELRYNGGCLSRV